MHVADSWPNFKREGGITGDWTRWGPLESGRKPSQLLAHGSSLISKCNLRVLGGTGDGDRRPWGQYAPTAYAHEGGGTLQNLSRYPGGLKRLRPGKGPGTYCSIWGRSKDVSTSLEVLGPTGHGGQGWRVVWTPVQGVPRCNTRQPPVPYAFQRGCGHRNPTLGDGGDYNRGEHSRTWFDNHRPRGIFICQRWPHGVNPTREAKEGVWRPHQTLQPGRPTDKHGEDGWHGMPVMPLTRWDIRGGLQETDGEEGSNILGRSEEDGGMPIVRKWNSRGLAADAPSESARRGAGGPGNPPSLSPTPPPREAQTYQVSSLKHL